ncbi:hypothetical protein LTS08_007995 [Lithohypha guttulata]|uniref:uncharacterized protein n=1 Tax=Lithohypha guttulata TaxID=1690604 RepID=UPI002DDFD6B1|nr:hypothetical protein LTR51_004654 [Lithohypha guttulata]KAK5095602.1 hypothetical protein LTS08_007995 [Lithohypha guttulata]
MAASSKPLHIVIVGGSLAGLMAAIPLRRLGHKVTILERSPVPLLHDQGAGVVAGGDTLEWVRRHGRSKHTADDISTLSQWRYYLDRQGNVIDQENSHQRMTSWGVLYNLGRENFDDPGNIQGGGREDENARYEYGRKVIGVEDKGDQIELKYERCRQQDEQEGHYESIQSDFLIIADGPSTHLRKMLLGEATAERTYAGYVAFRGTVPEAELSDSASNVFVEKFSFFHGTNPNTQILAYTIPGAQGTLVEGQRLVNWVWYHNVPFDSEEYAEIMTDKNGSKHRFTLPTGGFLQAGVWERQRQLAQDRLPPQFAELVFKTNAPFVQAITDLEPPKNKWEVARQMKGKAVIVGDALAGFRPHTAASTSQAAFHALRLEEVFSDRLSWDDYEEMVFEYATKRQKHGVWLGTRSQFGHHRLAS